MPDHEGASVVAPDLTAPDDAPGDGAGWGAQLIAKLDLSLGKLSSAQDATTSELRQLRREARNTPAQVSLSSVFTFQSGTPFICQQGGSGIGVLVGGPEVGQQWSVKQIIVGGTTLTATPAGIAWFLISPTPPNELSITSVADFTGGALPQVSFYGERDIYVPPNSNFFMVITGGTNGVQYVASVTFQQTPFVPTATEITT